MSENNLSNESIVIIVIIALLVLSLGGMGFWMLPMMSGMMGNYFSSAYSPVSWLFSIVQSVLIIVLLVLGILWLIKKINEKEGRQ